MDIKPMEIVKIGTVFALYNEQGELIIANRDRAAVEAVLRAHKVKSEPQPKPEEKADDWPGKEQGLPEGVPEEEPDLPDLGGLSYRELKAIAKNQEIPHYQRMKKADLLAAIEQLMADTGVEDEGEAGDGPEF